MSEPIYRSEVVSTYATPEELAADLKWYSWIGVPAIRLEAATAYMATRVEGMGRKAAKRAKRDAVNSLPSVRAMAASRDRMEREVTAARRAEAERRHAAEVEAARLPLTEVLALAMKHAETCRFFNRGTWRNRRWELNRAGSQPFRDTASHEANAEAYEGFVSILGRRATNAGGGIRHDVTASTKNDAGKVRLARAIARGVKVSPSRLMAIEDAHARAFAIQQTGGIERVMRLLPVVERTTDGTLLDGAAAGLENDVLMVRCPSTKRAYAMNVTRQSQQRYRTVRHALRAVNRIESAKIVAQS